MSSTPPVALTIAGSDNSAGAGIQADLKTFTAHRVYGLTAVTCVVAEVPGRVSRVQPIDPDIVAEQIELSFAAFPVAAVKTGMLYSREIIDAVCDALDRIFSSKPPVPIVVDPVMVATSGDPLLKPDAVDRYKTRLFPMATLVTPNLDEVRALAGRPVTTEAEMRLAGRELSERFATSFLIKGGHLAQDSALDLLCTKSSIEEFRAPFAPGVSTHGTGCTFAAAITSNLASGLSLKDATAAAKKFVTGAIRSHFSWPVNTHKTDALNHFTPVAE
jgi:hydroxymethylpyrimidine/phosphomethylpyrimidine kinase